MFTMSDVDEKQTAQTMYIIGTVHFLTGKSNIYRLKQELGNYENLSEMSITFCSRQQKKV